MDGGLRIFIILAAMFIGIYIYSVSYKHIKKTKKNKIRLAKLKAEEIIKQKKLSLEKIREEKEKIVALRREEIKEQFKWLKEMNRKIESKNSLT